MSHARFLVGDVFERMAELPNGLRRPRAHLAAVPLKAMCPQRVCRTCGKPSERVTGPAEYHQSPNAHGSGRAPDDVAARTWESGIAKGKNQSADLRDGGVVRVAPTLGWTDCGHGDWRNGLVLDPFAGSGTTLAVAVGHGRDAIGIDLDHRNAVLAEQRVGMFLDVDHPTERASCGCAMDTNGSYRRGFHFDSCPESPWHRP